MNKEFGVSDEQLNACVDEQLDAADQTQLLEILRDNPELAHRNCQLHKAHELVKLTYQSKLPHETTQAATSRKFYWLTGLVATLLIGFGMVIGFAGSTYFKQSSSLLELANTVHSPAAGDKQLWQVIVHVSSNDPYRYSVLLDETERLLENSLKNQQPVQVEIMTNGKGLELVRNSDTQYARRLKSLQDRYQNLVVSACNQALSRLRKKGVDIELLPKTQVVPSALDEILSRQKQGWTYIRI